MRKLILFLLVLSLVSGVAGKIHYDISSDTQRVSINATVLLECRDSCPVRGWELSWSKPEGAKVLSIRDSLGKIEDYQVYDSSISIETNSGPPRHNETLEIRMRIDEDAEEVHDGLYKRTLSLPGFRGQETFGEVYAEDLLSGRLNFGFESGFGNNSMQFRGDGPVNTRIKFGDGHETRYFSFFGEKVDGAEIAYEVPRGTTGLSQSFRRFPVAVMEDDTYNSKVNDWSAGEYVSGAIQIRSPGSGRIDEDFLPVLAHEVVHGLNDRKLNWDLTRSSYFNEGSSKYVEFLVKRKLYGGGEMDQPPAELFGDEVTYRQEKGSDTYIYTLPPKGDRDELWNYYQGDKEYMKTWSPVTSGADVRSFGYAYSELIVRNYIVEGGSLRQLYRDLDVDREVESSQEKWGIYSRHLDMTPCKYDDRERFEDCLEEVNSYDYPVYSAKPSPSGQELEIDRLEVPNRTRQYSGTGLSSTSFMEFFTGFIEYLMSLIRAAVASL